MAENPSTFKLAAKTGLGLSEALEEEWPAFAMREIEGLSVWWLSVSPDGVEGLDKACEKQFGTGLPEPRRFAEGGAGARIYWAGDRQWFVTGTFDELPPAIAKVASATDQSDGWIAIRIEGGATRGVMEKVCGLDLHPSVFPQHAAARAPVGGMIALVACEDAKAGTFVIFFQRSSARSFVDHLRHAAHSTSPRG